MLLLTVVGADFLREVARSVPVAVVPTHVPGRGAHEAERDCRPVGPARGARRRDAHRHGRRRRPGRAVDGVICSQGDTIVKTMSIDVSDLSMGKSPKSSRSLINALRKCVFLNTRTIF